MNDRCVKIICDLCNAFYYAAEKAEINLTRERNIQTERMMIARHAVRSYLLFIIGVNRLEVIQHLQIF